MKCENCGYENKILFNVKWISENDNRSHQGYWCRNCAISGRYFLIRDNTNEM
jgi:protein-arginine kinase activator protein McsA